MYTLLLSFLVILDVYRSFILNQIMFTKYCLTDWISKLPGYLGDLKSTELGSTW